MLSCKLKIKKKNQQHESRERYETDYGKKTGYPKNKLTYGCKRYEDIKDMHIKNCQSHTKAQNHQYTFQPNFSSKKKNQKSRSIKKFIQDQENYQNVRQTKIKEFRTSITKHQASQYTCRPSIDRISKRICEKNNYQSEEVFQRLSKQKVLENIKDQEDLFSPKILNKSKSLKRSQNISELLHTDAVRRQSKRQMHESKKKQKQYQSPLINRNTNDLVHRKIYAQFSELIPEDQQQIPFVFAWTVFSEIFNIQNSSSNQEVNRKLCNEMAALICENEEQFIKRQKFWEFIQIIMFKKQIESVFFIQNLEQIQNVFGNLYYQRLAKPRKSISPIKNSFRPQTLKKSDRYAQKFRQKLLTETHEFMKTQQVNFSFKEQSKLEDLYMADYLMKKAENEKKKILKEQKQLKECTFKPKLYPSKYKKSLNRKESILSIQKSKISTKTLHQTETMKSTASLCNSMISHALKFRSMNNPNHSGKIKKKSVEVKNSEKEVLRMSIGRKNREFSNELKGRGYPKNIQNWTTYTQKQKQSVIKNNKRLKGYAYKKITLK